MLKRILWLATGLAALSLLHTAQAEEAPFPQVGVLDAGDVVIRTSVFSVGSHAYRADYGVLAVLESRDKIDSRTIRLPLVRLHAIGEPVGGPVFLLAGGPGRPNVYLDTDLEAMGMTDMPYRWLLEHHDFVMVGYRGFDGESYLSTPHAEQALHVESLPLSPANLKRAAEALREDYTNLREGGVDVDAYNVVQVADDLESARVALGYDSVNLYSLSYGTRVAYTYGLRHPDSIRRTVMVGANFPGGFVWEPGIVEAQLRRYGELWQQEPANLERSSDILGTMRRVLVDLENGRKWLNFDIDVEKVKIMSFVALFTVDSAVQLFDAYVAAEHGDYSGMAYLSKSYDMHSNRGLGDLFSKAASVDFDPNRDYSRTLDVPGEVLGAPFSKLYWIPESRGAWPIRSVAPEFREAHRSQVETLIVNGDLDFSTPLSQARKYLDWLDDGQLVTVSHAGHVSDVEDRQPFAFQNLVLAFFETGRTPSTFVEQPVNFTPSTTLTSMAKAYVMKFVAMGLGLVALVAALALWVRKKRTRV